MSDDDDQSGAFLQRAGDWLEDYYQFPALAVVLLFMLWVRTRSWEKFIVDGEVFFGGNDPWYHYRMVQYTVQHWPATMPFDPWTGFPVGVSVGQFGTLFDQLIATAALIVGLGSPTDQTIAMTVLFAPAVFGALVAIPTYFLGKRLAGRLGGILSALVLGLLPGLFLARSLVGAADHNIAEPLFMTTAVVAMMVAVSIAERDLPVWEQVREREFSSLRNPLGWSVLAGIATALYLYVWPPGVLLIGIFGTFFVVQLASDYYNNTSPDHVAFVAATSMTVTGLLVLTTLSVVGFSASQPSLLQPLFAFAVAGGAVFMAWLARQWDARDLDAELYPVTVGAVILGGIGFVAVALPSLWNLIQSNLLRFVGFSAGAAQRTIGEAQPFLSQAQQYGTSEFAVIFLDYGLTFFVAILGALWLLWKPTFRSGNAKKIAFAVGSAILVALMFYFPSVMQDLAGVLGVNAQLMGVAFVGLVLAVSAIMDDRPAEHLLVVVWGAFLTSAAFTQVRFNYYLAVPVAALSAYAAIELLRYVSTTETSTSAFEDVEWTQVFAVVLVVMVLIVPLIAPFTFPSTTRGNISSSTAADVGNRTSPGAVVAWDPLLDWMSENTPAEGNYGGAGNGDQLDYYGTYPQTSDYQYPEGAYGVMSWWDYGHWITVEGERIPVANPFQQHATVAANYLLAQNESAANNVLQDLGGTDEQTRYVAVDWQMASINSKFGAPTVFYDANESVGTYDFYSPLYQQTERGYQYVTNIRSQRYYESMMVRLYRYHGSSVQPGTTVIDWDRNRPMDGTTADAGEDDFFRIYIQNGENDSLVKRFNTTEAAQAFVRNDTTHNGEPTAQIGGLGGAPAERIEALEHYRLVKTSPQVVSGQQILRGSQFRDLPSWVKLFERVPGATVHGTAPANTTVTATVTLEAPAMPGGTIVRNTTTYTQRAETGPDGEFTMTLPYSTTGYENWGTEDGYTNVSVRATGPYTFTTGNMTNETVHVVKYNATGHVPEAAVIGESDETVEVDLTREVVQVPEGAQNQSDTNGTDTGNETNTTTNDTNTSALTPPTTLDSPSVQDADRGSAHLTVSATSDALDQARAARPVI